MFGKQSKLIKWFDLSDKHGLCQWHKEVNIEKNSGVSIKCTFLLID